MREPPTPFDVAQAWHSVADRWITRRNKMNREGEQWEVVHDWGGDLISDKTMKVVAKLPSPDNADHVAMNFEDEARGKAVLALFTEQRK